MKVIPSQKTSDLTLIIDGNNLAHRCRHVFSLSNNGVDVSVTYGFLRVLMSLIVRYQPASVICAWDHGVANVRRQAVPSYKANRTDRDDDPLAYEDFKRQMMELRDYVFSFTGVVSVFQPGVEADDLMYHASRLIAGPSIIVTGDKDLLQACSSKVQVLNHSHNTLYDMRTVAQQSGSIPFERYVEWRAIQGDSSDNIAGVAGIGPITASKLIIEYGSLASVYEAAQNGLLSAKLSASIVEFGLERLLRNLYIMDLTVDRYGARRAYLQAVEKYQPLDKNRLKKYLLRNSFTSLLNGDFIGALSRLTAPKQEELNTVRVPAILAVTRQPV